MNIILLSGGSGKRCGHCLMTFILNSLLKYLKDEMADANQ